MISKEQKEFLIKYKLEKIIILLIQTFIVLGILFIWEYLSRKNIINTFIFSRPSKIIKTIVSLYRENNLFKHIKITIYETIISFAIGLLISLMLSTILYLNKFFSKIIDPFLTIMNSLPKVALGPMIIIIVGANMNSIIVMSVLINVIVCTIVISNGFNEIDSNKIKLMKSLGANKWQMLKYLIIPGSYKTIISSFKLNISMSLIGVVTGEFLVSKAGIGYLIIYGTQVFNLDLVITGILLLLILSYILYKIIEYIEKLLLY